ncbi:MAG: dihydrofolate reductase family protein [Acidimicrobiia bacterium]|nr:dihydrofolate reductase family protein [Acidimicrobiia bacterium]MDH4364956.1 dihydrofolate reductase family protein [Acidimicrobiia bacterium]MDH5288958.1 dihydrofolate reductase family protein [Acidimicrobiia bacterium]
MATLSVLYPTPPGLDGETAAERHVEPLEAVAAEARTPLRHRPWLLTNMIASADGATAVGGLSGPLGGPADLAVFSALRAVSDAIVVGGQTVRAERYRPPGAGSPRARAARTARGQRERPLLVVVTASLGLDLDLPLFADPSYRPLVATVRSADPIHRRALAEVADVVTVGDTGVDMAELLVELGRRGHRVVLSEGGPSLNAQLVVAELVDEWNLTIAPLLGAGQAKRPAQGVERSDAPAAMHLDRVWLADQLLFCRWLRDDAAR